MPRPDSETEHTTIPSTTPARSQPQSDLATDNQRHTDEPAAVDHGSAGDTTTETSTAIPPNPPLAVDLAISGAPPTSGTKACTQEDKPLKRKHFQPSKAQMLQCVSSHTLPSHCHVVMFMCCTHRGLAEREWACDNEYGTKSDFGDHFKNLSDEQREVRETRAVTNLLTSHCRDSKSGLQLGPQRGRRPQFRPSQCFQFQECADMLCLQRPRSTRKPRD